MSDAFDVDGYVTRATAPAVAGAASAFERHGGAFLGAESWADEDGHWLRVRGRLTARPDVEVHFARVLLLASGPDLAPETEATIYSSGFEEELHLVAPRAEAVDGVIVL